MLTRWSWGQGGGYPGLLCRVLGHRWIRVETVTVLPARRTQPRECLYCVRCLAWHPLS